MKRLAQNFNALRVAVRKPPANLDRVPRSVVVVEGDATGFVKTRRVHGARGEPITSTTSEARDCPECEGDGKCICQFCDVDHPKYQGHTEPCSRCHGTGKDQR